MFDQDIGKEISQDCAIFVPDLNGILLANIKAALAQTVGQAVFVNLFRMPVAQITVKGKTLFADMIR